MTKIVFCYTVPQTFGFSKETISLLKDNDYTVVLISSKQQQLAELATELNVDYKYLDLNRDFNIIKDILSLFNLIIILWDIKPDIVIGASPKAAFISMLASRFVRIKHRIYHIFGLPFETATGLKRKLLISVEKITSRFATTIIPISHSVKDVYIYNFPMVKHKIQDIGCLTVGGVNVFKFDKQRFISNSVVIKSDLGIPINTIVIGFVARLTIDKGIGDYIKMWNILKNKRKNIVTLLIGDRDERDNFNVSELQKFINDERVFHIHSTNEIEKYFSIMDIFVLPSYREGFGNVIAEASSMKIPVVSYNVTGCKDSVRNGYSGILVKKGDIISLTSEVIALIDSPENRQILGANGRIYVEENFRCEFVAETFKDHCQLISLNNK